MARSATAKRTSARGQKETETAPALNYLDIVKGVSASVVQTLIRKGILDRADVHAVVAERTLNRRLAQGQNLTPTEADAIVRLLRVTRHAEEVLDDRALAKEWLHSPIPALNGAIPIEMARTDAGAREVEGVLERFAHGDYS